MHITQIEVYKFPVKLKKPFVISLGSFDYAENVVVVVRTDEDLTGFGECSPFMPINGESMETCYVVSNYLAQSLIGKNPLDIGACFETMDRTILVIRASKALSTLLCTTLLPRLQDCHYTHFWVEKTIKS